MFVGEPSWCLIGRMFVREPSWEYSANLVGSSLNWADVCLRTYLEIYGEPSWFLIGRTSASKT